MDDLENDECLVLCEPDDHTFFQIFHLSNIFCSTVFILFFNSSWGKMTCAAFNSIPQPAATTFAFPSVRFFFCNPN